MNLTLILFLGFVHGITDVLAFILLVSNGKLVPNSMVYSPYLVTYQGQMFSRYKVFAKSAASSDTLSDQNRSLARQYIKEGMESFRNGDVSKSIEYFNAAEQNDRSITPYLWQRGLSYYYNQQYEKASQQFRVDVSVNPYDVEEIVWDIASQIQYIRRQRQDQIVEEIVPTLNQLSLPPGSKDRRKIMVRLFQSSKPCGNRAFILYALYNFFICCAILLTRDTFINCSAVRAPNMT
jgi:tetratricopeptide (TPR) repeat protein